jgi:hypothetical protein
MSIPNRYIRLFDLAKYREIQPVTDGIDKRNVDPGKVIDLIKRAMDIAQSSDFKKYNSEITIDFATFELQEALEIMQEKSILDWYSYGSDKLNQIISLICCPRYQSSPNFDETDSDAVINYISCYLHLENFNKKLYEMLAYRRSETLPSDDNDEAAAWVFSRQELMELSIMVKQDLDTLSQPNGVLYEISGWEGSYIQVAS